MIDFSTVGGRSNAGFIGFTSVNDLRASNLAGVSEAAGVYMALFEEGGNPVFLEVGTGGHFKGKDPNISLAELKSNWVPGALVIYIGKAGGGGSNPTLRKRLSQYLRFGDGKSVGHRGGRLIWQILGSESLRFCWKETGDDDPREVERLLIAGFRGQYGSRPFANLQD